MGLLGKFMKLISVKVLHEYDLKGIGDDVPIVVVVGASGVGKTQFIRTLSQAYNPEFKSSAGLEPHTKKIAIVRCEIGSQSDIRTRVILVDTPPQLDESDIKATTIYREEIAKIKRLFPHNRIYILYLFNSTANRAPDFPLYKILCYSLCQGQKNRLFVGCTMWDKKTLEMEARFPLLEAKWTKAWAMLKPDPEQGKDENLKSAFKYDNTQASALELMEKILSSEP
ncbi:hypothetical protein BJ165DRAFT_1506526 [Panaeolus papilionaceus]|nr:hypothetical protein BJ165DRAFT_1506526 [Panaeolus papilionaceus]